MKHALMQMQYRFVVIYETPSTYIPAKYLVYVITGLVQWGFFCAVFSMKLNTTNETAMILKSLILLIKPDLYTISEVLMINIKHRLRVKYA